MDKQQMEKEMAALKEQIKELQLKESATGMPSISMN